MTQQMEESLEAWQGAQAACTENQEQWNRNSGTPQHQNALEQSETCTRKRKQKQQATTATTITRKNEANKQTVIKRSPKINEFFKKRSWSWIGKHLRSSHVGSSFGYLRVM